MTDEWSEGWTDEHDVYSARSGLGWGLMKQLVKATYCLNVIENWHGDNLQVCHWTNSGDPFVNGWQWGSISIHRKKVEYRYSTLKMTTALLENNTSLSLLVTRVSAWKDHHRTFPVPVFHVEAKSIPLHYILYVQLPATLAAYNDLRQIFNFEGNRSIISVI